MSKVIAGFRDSLKTEEKSLSDLHSDIKKENAELVTSLTAKVDKMQEDLAMENQVMDKLA